MGRKIHRVKIMTRQRSLFPMVFSRMVVIFCLTCSGGLVWSQEQVLDPINNVDPWESTNRKIFAFNETLDRWILKPVAEGYNFVMPDIAKRGVTNFILNMYEFNSVLNGILQGKFSGAATSGGRFIINSTVGLAGLIDVATPMGIEPQRMDFGQTLAVWGVDTGPFVMLPLFGPRTVRSATGYFVDTYSSIPAWIEDRYIPWTFWTIEVIDFRASLLQSEDLITGDRYIFLRDAYLQRREFYDSGGVVKDNFSDFQETDEEWEEF